MGPSFFLAAFLLFSALVISYLLPAREITPQPPQPTASSSAASLPRVAESLLEAVLHPSHRVVHGVIGRGQTFAEVLSAKGLSGRLTHEIGQALRPYVNFRKIQAGTTFRARLDKKGALLDFRYEASPLEIYDVTRKGPGLQATRREIPVERRVETIAGTVTSSLFESMEGLGEKPELTVRFVNIFLWDFDFNSNARPGDQFRMLVEKEYGGGTFVRYGKILIAQYENRGKTYTGIYFETRPGKGDFYTPKGRSVRKTFLRSPLRFTRISSRYTHRRRHPILGGVRPHLAIDYAAPRGTPVRSVADGVVLSARWKGGNGKSVLVRHRNGYRTMYNHLSRFARGIRKGTRVRQKQVIGYVGSTGLSTGSHLDYRVVKNGRFVNPLRQKFIPGDPIPKSQRATFRVLRDRLLHELQPSTPTSAKVAPDPPAVGGKKSARRS
ncbi:MAG: M23 family metallopeptidase [candidate division NC10 bacterium]|nr:M23 family metallopeptidase [candidate division NC10 bacterium]